jgi:hypothetical protein
MRKFSASCQEVICFGILGVFGFLIRLFFMLEFHLCLCNMFYTILFLPLSFLKFNLRWDFGVGTAGSPLAEKYIEPRGEKGSLPFSELDNVESHLSITIVGASGDLAKKKIFPALFALYYEDCLPEVPSCHCFILLFCNGIS